jgi:cell division protein ZapA
MNELSIKVNIGGRSYPLTIKREEEEKVRKAALEIDKCIKELKSNYAVVDMQDLLAMTALQFANDSTTTNHSLEFDKLSQEIILLKDQIIN